MIGHSFNLFGNPTSPAPSAEYENQLESDSQEPLPDDSEDMDMSQILYHIQPPNLVVNSILSWIQSILKLHQGFKAFSNCLPDESIDHAMACFQGLTTRKVFPGDFDSGHAQMTCHCILWIAERGSTAIGTVCKIPKFWINFNGLNQSSNLTTIETTITHVFCMQEALKFHYWLLAIISATGHLYHFASKMEVTSLNLLPSLLVGVWSWTERLQQESAFFQFFYIYIFIFNF